MPKRLQKEIEKLKNKVLNLAAIVEDRVRMAVKAIDDRDEKLAEKVVENDFEINDLEVDLEEDSLKVLALHQPVAIDLRYIVAILKINNDLERIGDLAVNIAERAAFLATQPKVDIPFDFPAMSEIAQSMLRKAIDALVNMDAELAYEVLETDDKVDELNRKMYTQVEEGLLKCHEHVKSLMHILSTSRHLERVADHATNIAEDVIYLIEGEVVRHRAEDYRAIHKNPKI